MQMSTTTAPKPELLTPELLAQLERLELVTRKVFRGRMKGERRSKRKGQSVEFADFRNYVAGDDLRLLVPRVSIFTRSARHKPMKPSDAASCLAYCSLVGSPKSMLALASIRV